MKIRYGFVSNSSSSSFTCAVCKDTAEDYNGECEIEYVTCEEGHQICTKHVKSRGKKSVKDMRQVLLDDVDGWDHCTSDERESERDSIRSMDGEEVEDAYNDLICGCELTKEECPLCSFKILTDEDLMTYLLSLLMITKKDAIKRALTDYSDYDSFRDAMKKAKAELRRNQ